MELLPVWAAFAVAFVPLMVVNWAKDSEFGDGRPLDWMVVLAGLLWPIAPIWFLAEMLDEDGFR